MSQPIPFATLKQTILEMTEHGIAAQQATAQLIAEIRRIQATQPKD